MADDELVSVMVKYGTEDYDIQINPNEDTMLRVKEKLEEATGVAIADQDLSFNRLKMTVYDDKLLSYYRFSGGCFMTLKKKE